jgi:CO/xanthine dehydrogenase Mo-binding subunit
MVRSPHAHARILAIDVAAARVAPGVVGVFTATDLGVTGGPIPIYAPHPALPSPCHILPLAVERVRFVGEPVAVVVADDPYRAWDAADLVRVEYEPLPAIVDAEAAAAAARRGCTIISRATSPRSGDSVWATWTLPCAAPPWSCARASVSRGVGRTRSSRAGLVARWRHGRLIVHAAVQMVHRHRGVFATTLGVPEADVHVIAPADVGGGFGTKGMLLPGVHRRRRSGADAGSAREVDRDAARAHAGGVRRARADPRRRDRGRA